jgi:hypothetical protein
MTFIFENYTKDTDTVISEIRAYIEALVDERVTEKIEQLYEPGENERITRSEALALLDWDSEKTDEVVSDFSDVLYVFDNIAEAEELYQDIRTIPPTMYYSAHENNLAWYEDFLTKWENLITKCTVNFYGSAQLPYYYGLQIFRDHLLGTSYVKDITDVFTKVKAVYNITDSTLSIVTSMVRDPSLIEGMCQGITDLENEYNKSVSALAAVSFREIMDSTLKFTRVEYALSAFELIASTSVDDIYYLMRTSYNDLLDNAGEILLTDEQIEKIRQTLVYYAVTYQEILTIADVAKNFFGGELLSLGELLTDNIGEALYALKDIFDLSSVSDFCDSLMGMATTSIVEVADSLEDMTDTVMTPVTLTINNLQLVFRTLAYVIEEGKSDGSYVGDAVIENVEGVLDNVQDVALKSCAASNIAINQLADLMVSQNRVTEFIKEVRDTVYSVSVEEITRWQDAYTDMSTTIQQGVERGSSFV